MEPQSFEDQASSIQPSQRLWLAGIHNSPAV